MGGVEARAHQARAEVIAVNAGDGVGVEDIGRPALDQHLLVIRHRIGLFGGDEGRADIGQIGPHRLCRQNRTAIGNRT